MDINQVYKAPSIPKLNKTNISSSVLKGAAATVNAPKIKKSTFSFIKPGIVLDKKVEGLKPETSPIQITETLVETNRILVEIQKQLSLDFAMRIAEEKETIKKIKEVESKRKFASKESFVEGVKKVGGILGNVVGKVTAPIKNVFEKIKQFFSLILTGVLLNAAFSWVRDENNRKTLSTIFDWIGNSFVPVLIGIITYKLIKWIGRLYRLAKFLWKLPGRLSQLVKNLPSPYRSPSNLPRGQTPFAKPSPLSGSPLTRGPGYAPGIQPKLPTPLYGPTGQPLPTDPLRGATPGRAPGIPKPGEGITPKTTTPPRGPQLPAWLGKTLRVVGLAFLISELQEDWRRGDIKAIAVKLSAYGLGWLTTILVAAGGTALGIGTAPTGAGAVAGFGLAASSFAAGYGVDVGVRKAFGYKDGGTIKASNGMTVPGKRSGMSGMIDSVKAMLAPGEEVIRSASSMLFRPLLKDINDNAGRLWMLFSMATKKLLTSTEYANSVSEEFSKVIEDFDGFLKKEIQNKKTGKRSGGGGLRPSTKSKPSLQSSTSVPNINLLVSQSSGVGGMTVLPMVLPKQSNPPQIPTPQTVATDIPIISPINPRNPYMSITSEYYNIQMFAGV